MLRLTIEAQGGHAARQLDARELAGRHAAAEDLANVHAMQFADAREFGGGDLRFGQEAAQASDVNGIHNKTPLKMALLSSPREHRSHSAFRRTQRSATACTRGAGARAPTWRGDGFSAQHTSTQ